MRGVNLARRPFVNRRPVARLAVVLWLAGFALLLVNVRLFGGHWRGKAVNSELLAEVSRKISEERKELSALDRQLRRVNVRRLGRQTEFLNSLITSRTFPWSALFDDLEEVLPYDVRLVSVKPTVRLQSEPSTRRPARSRRAAADDAEPTAEPLRRDEVALKLSAVAKTEDAMIELIERLYASPSFRAPYLPGELRNLDSGATSFSLSVVYLTRPAGVTADEPEVVLVDPAATSEAGEGPVASAPAGSTPAGSPPGARQGAAPDPAETAATAGTRLRQPGAQPPRPSAPAGAATAPGERAALPSGASPGANEGSTGRPATARPGSTVVGIGASGPAEPRPEATPSPGDPAPAAGRSPRDPAPVADEDEPPPGRGVAEPPASATPRLRRGGSQRGAVPALARPPAADFHQELAA